MWRGPVVAGKKSAGDAARQKKFLMHAKLIQIAAKQWGDPDTNPSLANAIDKARKDNFPNDNIAKAIKVWTWEHKDWVEITQIDYEWYGAGWVAFIVSVLTDNKNRTASNIRHTFSKFGGNMWEPGSVSFSFNRRGVIFIDTEKYDYDKIEELVFETDVLDFSLEWKNVKILTETSDLQKVKEFFAEKNIELEVCDLDYIPQNYIEITEFDQALKVLKMIDTFEDDEDVENVCHNLKISDELKKEVEEFIEKNTFRT